VASASSCEVGGGLSLGFGYDKLVISIDFQAIWVMFVRHVALLTLRMRWCAPIMTEAPAGAESASEVTSSGTRWPEAARRRGGWPGPASVTRSTPVARARARAYRPFLFDRGFRAVKPEAPGRARRGGVSQGHAGPSCTPGPLAGWQVRILVAFRVHLPPGGPGASVTRTKDAASCSLELVTCSC
jgi:hypothetical protein